MDDLRSLRSSLVMDSPPLSPMRQNYSCDTIPPPQNPARREELVDAPGSADAVASAQFEVPQDDEEVQVDSEERHPAAQSARPQPPARKLCVRHQRMADEGTIVKLQSSLDALPVEERETVSTIWSTFSSSSHPRRELILRGILTMCCFSQLSLLSEQLINLIRVDPFSRFPREVSLKVLRHLDAISLGRAAQVNRHWRSLADDNVLWKSICEQHIDKQCRKCGWGLPLLEKRRAAPASSTPRPAMPLSPAASSSSLTGDSLKRAHYDEEHEHEREHEHPAKRHKSDSPPPSSSRMSVSPIRRSPTPSATGPSAGALSPSSVSTQRPWKDIYCERLTIARNWRRGRYSVRTLKGHGDSVMCLQFNEAMRGVNYPMLITGSYDRTVRVWNVDAGEEVQCLRGHTRAVRALQFDEAKLITGSMDCTLRVWDWRTGRCIRTLQGHSEGVVCLKFDSNVLASGSVDTTVKVWNFRTGECFTLRGHKDWVNAVQLWQLPGTEVCSSVSSASDGTFDIDPGKMLFSASDDCTIRLWDLSRKSCVRQFVGHVGQVQSLLLLNMADCPPAQQDDDGEHHPGGVVRVASASSEDSLVPPGTRLPHLISGSLDNTIKTWDIETGLATQTLFGHIEGVWSVVGDSLRLASGSHDKTIKVWQREESAPPLNLVGHEGPVTCLQLSDDKIISGSDDHTIKVWSFSA